MARSFKNLLVWQRGMALAEGVYGLAKTFPRHEQYGLCDQMRRAAVSVPSNIAEGCGRGTDRDWAHFLGQALGSLCELETQLELAVRLGYAKADALLPLQGIAQETGKMLVALIRKFGGKQASGVRGAGESVRE